MGFLAWRCGVAISALALVAFAGSLAGCNDPANSGGSVTGTLGRAKFFYECIAPSDPQCDAKSNLAPNVDGLSFPPIAVGARFGILEKSDFGTGVTSVASLGDFFDLDEASGELVALRKGVGALAAYNDSKQVVDTAQIEFAVPASLKLLFATEVGDFQSGAIVIEPGSVRGDVKTTTVYNVRVFPVDDKGRPLAGAFPIAWTTSAPATLKFRDPSRTNDNVVALETGTAGRSTIAVKLGALQASFEVEVKP